MSNKTQLQTNNTALDGYIARINATKDVAASLPEAGGSGGGSVETCTVTIARGTSSSDTSGTIDRICYTSYLDGVYSSNALRPTTSGAQTITNVVKNSIVVIPNYPDITDSNLTNATPIYGDLYYKVYSINGDNANIHIYACYIYGTKILLHNNTMKEVQDITYNDELLVWDFDNGCYTHAKPLWIKKEESACSYYHCIFDNGITLDLVGSNGNCHAVFCLDDNCFEYANKCVGKMIMTQNGAAKLLSCELRNETVKFYNIITNYHINCYANSVLTSTKLNNIYTVKDMKFIKDDRDIIPYEEFDDIPIEYYVGLRLGEHKTENISLASEKVKLMLKNQV